MKRVLTIAAALLVFAAPSFAQQKYGWTISSSATDPNVNSGLTSPAPVSLFLWLACAAGPDGMSAAEFNLSTPAGLLNFGFTTMNGFLNAGGSSNLLLAVGGCPTGPVVAGSWTFFGTQAGDICIVPSGGGVRATVDCNTSVPGVWPIEAVGYGYGTSGDSCREALCIVSVEPSSWGSVKSLYR